jgi:hypothetical protein
MMIKKLIEIIFTVLKTIKTFNTKIATKSGKIFAPQTNTAQF